MSSSSSVSPSVFAAATTLAAWAHERRRAWSDVPLPRPMPRAVVVPEVAHVVVPEVVPEVVRELIHDVVMSEVIAPDAVELCAEEIAQPSHMQPQPIVSAYDVVLSFIRRGGAGAITALERIRPLADSAAGWLMRGAAVVSTMSVVLLVGVNRGEVLARWDRATTMVKAATTRPVELPPPGPAKGTGRLTITSSNGAAEVAVDGKPRGVAPVTVDLSAGPHRIRLASEKGSVERSVKIQAGESSEMSEAIFPGWLAVTAPIDLTLSEGRHVFDRDDRGWALMAPGPHDIHFDNRALGVHEVRRVLVKPGEPTWLSVVPPVSQ